MLLKEVEKKITSILFFLVFISIVQVGSKTQQCFDFDVLILGGGVSGITALSKLAANGVSNVKLLEGQGKIGGRLRKHKVGDTVVELGANWVHGIKGNPIFKLVKAGALRGQVEDPNSLVCRDLNGNNVTEEFLRERGKLTTIFDKISLKSSSNIWTDRQWKWHGRAYKSLRELLLSEGWVNDTAVKNIAEISVLDFQDAVSPELVSSRTMFRTQGHVKSLSDKQLFITDQDGFVSILKYLPMEPAVLDQMVLLNETVTKIYWNKNGARVVTSKGSSYTAKIVLITFSIGVLQNENLFIPPLPSWKLDAIDNIQMAIYSKIFLKFSHKFWDNVEYIYVASGQRGFFPVLQSLDAGRRMGFETNVLMVTITEDEARRIEAMEDMDVVRDILNMLRKVYGDEIPEPTHYVIPRWGKDPYFYGSYSYYGTLQTHQLFIKLQSNVGPLFFAGEALHETYQGYLHGAFCQAEAAAFDINSALHSFSTWQNFNEANFLVYDNCYRDSCGGCYETL